MRRPIIFVLLAGFAALVAALVVYSALKKREQQVQEAMLKSVEIVVAAKDVGIGSKLDPSSVKMVRWSRDSIPPGAFTDTGAVMNQFTKTGFVQNEPIVADRLFTGEKNAGVLPLLIPPGMRALSVPVDEVSDIAGFVLPHTRVDVLVAVATGPTGDKPYSKIVLQNIEVLAIAQDIENSGDKAQLVKVVTFLVTPEQAERLTLASREGALRLAMRNYDDNKIVMTSGVDVTQMLRAYGGPQVGPMPPAPQLAIATQPRRRPKPIEVEVLRNGKSSENVSFVRSRGSSDGAAEQAEPAGPSSSAADKPDNVSDASGAVPVASGLAATDMPAAHDPARTRVNGATGAAAPAHTLAALGSSASAIINPGADGFASPKSKTIDVP